MPATPAGLHASTPAARTCLLPLTHLLRRLSPGLPQVDSDPMAEFGTWFEEVSHCGLQEPNAMVVSSCSGAGAPSARCVLLKGYDQRGFWFFTK